MTELDTRASNPEGLSQTELAMRALLTEYSSLRSESVSAIGYRVQVITFTFASLSVIMAGLITRNLPDRLAGLLSLFVVPQIAKASLMMWLGEYNRSIRAGRYLRSIETKLNSLIGAEMVGWESQLVSGKQHMGYPYVATACVILGVGYVGSAMGVYLLAMTKTGPSVLAMIILATYAVVWEVSFYRRFRSLWTKIRQP